MSLEITYFAEGVNKTIYGSAILSETRSSSASSAQSGATPVNAQVVRMKALANVRFAYGANPTATATAGASGHYLGTGDIMDVHAVAGWKIAVIAA
jgi:hypothetical protein